jgi:hypothetical protein
MKIKKNKIKEILEGLERNNRKEEINEARINIESEESAKILYMASHIRVNGGSPDGSSGGIFGNSVAAINGVEVEYFDEGTKVTLLMPEGDDILHTIELDVSSGEVFAGINNADEGFSETNVNEEIKVMSKALNL